MNKVATSPAPLLAYEVLTAFLFSHVPGGDAVGMDRVPGGCTCSARASRSYHVSGSGSWRSTRDARRRPATARERTLIAAAGGK